MYQALYRKWRPQTFQDVVGQKHITDTLCRQVSSGRLSHAYLFTGTRGTGKTTCAKLLARAVNCEHPVNGSPCNECPSCKGIEDGSILDVVELDAASNNGVDQVRALRDEAVFLPSSVKKRVYIVDEVHMLTIPAFNALLKILEEPPEHLMFILATTELHKVPATIKSRCQQFAFRRLLPDEISQRLQYICTEEHIALSTDASALLAQLADGGMRDALSLLDQCAGYSSTVDVPQVLEALGLAGNRETASMMEAIARGQTAQVLDTLARLYAAGKELRSLLGELSSLARDLLVYQTAPDKGASLMTGGYEEASLQQLASLLPPARLIQMLRVLQSTLSDLGKGASPRTDAELCLIRICDPTLDGSPTGLTARLEQLERQLSGVSVLPAAAPSPVLATPSLSASMTPPPAASSSVPSPEPTPPSAESAPAENPASPPVAPDVPPIPEPVSPVQSPSEPQTAPVPEQPSAPSPPAAPDNELFWSMLLPKLDGPISHNKYVMLEDPARAAGLLKGEVLEVLIAEKWIHGLLDQDDIRTTIAEQAGTLAGHPVRTVIKLDPSLGSTPAKKTVSAPDPFQDLLNLEHQYDNVKIIHKGEQ